MYELINTMVKAHEKDAVHSKAKPKNAQSLRRAITELAAQENAKVPVERRVTQRDIEVVASRSLNSTTGLERPSRFFAAYREVASFIALATTGKSKVGITQNRDLLAVGHPLSTRTHAMTASAHSEAVARWIAADPRIADEVRPLVAAVYMTSVGSVDYKHAVARLTALPSGMVPQEFIIDSQLEPITASFMGWLRRIFGGGNSSTARSLRAKAQLRDREGKFAEQGGGLQFYVRMPDGSIKSKVGSHAGNAENGTDFLVEISGDPDIADGIYSVPASMTKAVKAIIPGDDAGGVSLPEGVEAVDLANIERKDIPDGWKLVREKGEGESGPDKVYATDDGYEVEVYETGNFGDAELKKAYNFNAGRMTDVPGQPVGNYTARVDAKGRLNATSKFSPNSPFYTLYRVETPETKRQAVLMAQRWSDVQQAAELDQDNFEKYYDAAEKYNAEKAEKKAKADAESKALNEAMRQKALEQFKKNEENKAIARANLDKGLDPLGNEIPEGWTPFIDEEALKPSEYKDQINVKPFSPVEGVKWFNRFDEKGPVREQLVQLEDGSFRESSTKNVVNNWDEANKSFEEKVKARIEQRRQDAIDHIATYDDENGTIGKMLEDGASPDELLAELAKNPKWKAAKDDWETSWAVDLPQKAQRDRWEKFGKGIDAINKLEQGGQEKTDEVKAELPEVTTKEARDLKPGDIFIDSKGNPQKIEKISSVDSGSMVSFRDATTKKMKNRIFEDPSEEVSIVPGDEPEQDSDGGTPAPTTPAPEPAAPAAPKPADDIQWILPDGAYSLWKADEYEPQGRIDEESPDFTDDPKVLANKFSTEQLKDALAQAIIGVKDFATEFLDELKDLDDEDEEEGAKKKTGPKKKKPKSKDATGFGQLDFSFGDENVPAEAIYSAIKEQGEDADLIAAELYDLPLGESKNVDMLEGLRSPEEVKAQEPSVLIDDFDRDAVDISDTATAVAQGDAAAVATAQMNDVAESGEQNEELVMLAEAMNEPGATLDSLLDEFIGFAVSQKEEQNQVYQALHSVLLSADGGLTVPGEETMLVEKIRTALKNFYGAEPTENEMATIFERYGYYKDLVLSKKAIVDGDESINDIDSKAGAFYRLVVAAGKTNEKPLYRGLQVDLDSDDFEKYTAEGGVISIDARSFADYPQLAEKFAGTLTKGNNDKASIIFTMPAGLGKALDITSVSPFEDERESLGFGNYKIAKVRVEVDPNTGKTVAIVRIEALDKRSELLEGMRDDYEGVLIENQTVELPEAYYTPSTDPFENMDAGTAADDAEIAAIEASNPLYIARAYEMEDLLGAFRGAIEDGTGKIQLLDEDEEYTVDVEAVRDALQIQGINTNAVLDDIANTEADVEAEDADIEPLEPVAESLLDEIITEFGQEYDLEGFEQTGPQQGSNAGGTFKDAEGNEFYVKSPKSDQHRRNELLASAFYKLAGVDAAEMRFGSADDGKEKIFSAIIPGNTLGDTDLTPETKKQIQEGFAIDAWLANWDVAGLVNDNIIIDEDGNAFRIDTGGALLFRAMGLPKGTAFGNDVTELDTLRNSSMNPTSAALFGDMTDEDLKASASKLLDISHSDIDNLVDATFDGDAADELKDKLKARRQFILEKYNLLGDDTSLIAETTKVEEPAAVEFNGRKDELVALGENPDPKVFFDTLFNGAQSSNKSALVDSEEYESLDDAAEIFFENSESVLSRDADGVWRVHNREGSGEEVEGEIFDNYRNGILGTDSVMFFDGDFVDKNLQLEIETGETTPATPEQPTPPTPEVPSEAPGNPYVTSDGVSIEPGMQVRHKKTGEVGTVIKYDKGNTSYVFVQGEDGSIKNKSTKQLESVNAPGGGEPPSGEEPPATPPAETPETPGGKFANYVQDLAGDTTDLPKDLEKIMDDTAADKLGAEFVDDMYDKAKAGANLETAIAEDLAAEPSSQQFVDNAVARMRQILSNIADSAADERRFIQDDKDLEVTFDKDAFAEAGAKRFREILENEIDDGDGGDGGGPKDEDPQPEKPGPTDESTQPEQTDTPKVIDTTGTVETAVKDIQSAIDNKQLISFYYNGKIRTMRPESIWENPKNGKINVYGEDLGDESKKKNFTVQQMQEIPDGSKPEIVSAEEPVAEPKKLQGHAQWIKDIMAQKGVSISDEKAVEIRDTIDNNALLEKWSSAEDSDLIEAIDEALGPDWNEAVGNTDWEKDDVEEDAVISGEQRQIIIDLIQKLAGIQGFPTEEYVNKVSNPNLTESEGSQLLEELQEYDDNIGGDVKVQAPGPNNEGISEGDEPDATETEAPTLEPGAEVTDKKGNKGTVLKGPNKDNYVFVQFEDGKTGWRSAGSVSTTGEFNESVKKAAPKATAGKMTPAGTKAVFVENPAGWDTSEFENVPALSDAIALVQNPDDKFAAMRGASAAIDADSIEDLDVRIMRVRDIDGNDGLRLKFKLTSWAGNARTKALMEMTPEQREAEGVTKGQMVVDRIDVGSDGVGQISKDKNSYQGEGVTWTITTPEGIVIKLYRGNYDATSKLSSSKYGQPRSFHNLVQIQAPADVTNEQIADALGKAGVSDVRPATPADSRILVENRLMSVFDGKVDATKNPKGADREASLQKIKDKYGITPDDVVITTGASGRIETRLSPEGAQKIVTATGSPTAIQHNISIPGFYGSATPEESFEQRTDWLAKLIGTPQGGLLSTTTRWTEGVGASGMSSAADIGTGGADYVFTKPVKVTDAKTYGTSGMLMYFDPVKVYQRLDFYANSGDNFGKRQVNQDVINAAKVGAYELMFKHRLSFDDLDSIVISTQAQRTAVIQKLRQMGIDQIGGRPLEAVIIIGSNVNPNS